MGLEIRPQTTHCPVRRKLCSACPMFCEDKGCLLGKALDLIQSVLALGGYAFSLTIFQENQRGQKS